MTVTGACEDRDLLLHGLADGELDAANALALEEHLKQCEACTAAYDSIQRHKQLLKGEAVRLSAPPGLLNRVRDQIEAEEGRSPAVRSIPGKRKAPFWKGSRPLAAFSAMALAASLVLFVSAGLRTPDIDSQLAAAHVRSLLASHLMDVESSDRHTVKPWFLGKLDFAPPVVDLGSAGFPLTGGRLDFVGGRVVPALVYKRHAHVINLFVWPAGALKAVSETLDGYRILSWDAQGFTFAAVSDLNAAELRDFEKAIKDALGS
jgi:anti-sigma factor RsiW